MELRHLRYFVAVAEMGSLTDAAEHRLFTSQPSLSRQIRDLEDEVGAPLFIRSARGVELTSAGRAFLDHARVVLAQVDAAVEAARRAAQPSKPTLALGFLTGTEMTWLPKAMQVLRDDLPSIDVTVSSDYSADLADALARGRLDAAFLRQEIGYGLEYRVVHREPLVVLMPNDHRLAARERVRPEDFTGERLVGVTNKSPVLAGIIETYLEQAHISMLREHGVDNLAGAMSLVASTRGLSLMPAYATNLLPWSVVSRPIEGDGPSIDLVVGYNKTNASPVLKRFLARLDELVDEGRAGRD
ncbi:LysR substrate-binding domain-containing protein [Pararobbsia silviterrae]|uniref:LysR family transcriptional regulator n=1 Tax=Pararobbsia silviterrae TaxID=1792498 RepID=A0A494XZ28_9BURK|nr:LysR substrate-binding domain-containing protein [Pararobbsia silviterrae]RKP53394.1 LysR family transcriptional regulator [Pararobbsia silviterrae]